MHRGERIAGRFEIIAEAGRGGMGTVFRATDRKLHRDVALKVLSADHLHSAARFEREASILASLRHPGIVEYITHGATPDGLFYLVMEWVAGETLSHRLDREGLTLRATVAMGREIALALAAMHAAGVVHRDLKPSNLMMMVGDHVKLVDFGVARRAHETASLTRTGAMIGTAGYMAPEQARGARDEVDARTDLFSLGCVLHECLSGRPAFDADTTLAVRAKILLHDPPPLRLLAPNLPAALDELVASLLSKRPAERPRDAAEVERALAAIGELPDGPPTRATGEASRTTVTSSQAELEVTAVLIGWPLDQPEPADDALAGLPMELERLEGGAIATMFGDAAGGATLALALTGRFPDAVVVVTSGPDLIDRGARMLGELEIHRTLDDSAAGDSAAGVWIDGATATLLGTTYPLERRGGRVRLRGAA